MSQLLIVSPVGFLTTGETTTQPQLRPPLKNQKKEKPFTEISFIT